MAASHYSRSFLGRSGLLADKWAQYLKVYDRELEPFLELGRPVHLLEIGIAKGGSLAIWEALLPPGSSVVAFDIEAGCAALRYGPSVRVVIQDATDAAGVQAALGDAKFDIIIDDGSHVSADIIAQFAILFPRLLPGGIYIIEDLHAAYWPSFGGGYLAPDSAISFLKRFVDALHTDYFEWDTSVPEAERARLVALNREIARIAFHDSITVIERLPETKTAPFPRVASGGEAPASQAPLADAGRRETGVSDDAALHAALLSARAEISALRLHVAALEAQLTAPAAGSMSLLNKFAAWFNRKP
jgi:hypothetical protein